ncbi:MAG: hypothetical protein KME17_00820 [Cyanosarcina radialis HA8281-LM2]|jgi:hypothetical protein|nr:hypothetical protein [Cyanosarcina radialis HA8281-LM2]
MTEIPSSPQTAENPENSEALLLLLRRKEGNWVEWGRACAKLQKAGYNPQTIFEQTGFEPIQQNQVIVGAQVYDTMVSGGVSEETRSRYARTGSDSLYELRILTVPERVAVAEFLHSRNLDSEAAKEVTKAVKEFSRLRNLPTGFTEHPGDAVAYQYWRYAKQQSGIQERSRLIARGLMFAHSQSARQQIEQLLMDFGGTAQRQAPNLPWYRLESAEQLPRILPVVSGLSLTGAELEAIPQIEETGAFRLVKSGGNGTWVSLPGWRVLLQAQDPVGIICKSSQIAHQPSSTEAEEVLAVIDRGDSQWDANGYFAIEEAGSLQIQWFPDSTDVPLLGRLILVVRPRKIIDESVAKDIWQIEE